MQGWSSCSSVHDRVSLTCSPAPWSVRSSSAGESGLRSGARSAARISPASRSSTGGRRPAAGRGPTRSLSNRSCTSTRHGKPAWVISAATSAPEDSAASSRASRPASAEAASAARWRSAAAAGSSRSAGSSSGKRAASDVGDRLQPVPAGGVVAGQQRLVDEGRLPQDRVREPQVGAALDPHPGLEQRRVPAGGVVPDPADRRRRLPVPDVAGQPAGGQGDDLDRRTVVVEFAGLDRAVPTAQQEDAVHACSLAETADNATD